MDELHFVEYRAVDARCGRAAGGDAVGKWGGLAFGSFGRVYLGGEERDIMAGYQAAVDAIESVTGREMASGKSE